MILCQQCQRRFRPDANRQAYCSTLCKAVADNANRRERRRQRKLDAEPPTQAPTLSEEQAMAELASLETEVLMQPGGISAFAGDYEFVVEHGDDYRALRGEINTEFFYSNSGPNEGSTAVHESGYALPQLDYSVESIAAGEEWIKAHSRWFSKKWKGCAHDYVAEWPCSEEIKTAKDAA